MYLYLFSENRKNERIGKTILVVSSVISGNTEVSTQMLKNLPTSFSLQCARIFSMSNGESGDTNTLAERHSMIVLHVPYLNGPFLVRTVLVK